MITTKLERDSMNWIYKEVWSENNLVTLYSSTNQYDKLINLGYIKLISYEANKNKYIFKKTIKGIWWIFRN